jgi:HNH endonuclease
VPRKIPEKLQEQVRQRANFLCEYCHTNERWQYVRFTIDHLIPASEGGEDNFENLCLACFHCNRRRSTKTKVIDKESGQTISLFNPRQHQWSEHFIWSSDGLNIIPLTDIGRITVGTLDLNRTRILNIRQADVISALAPAFVLSLSESCRQPCQF